MTIYDEHWVWFQYQINFYWQEIPIEEKIKGLSFLLKESVTYDMTPYFIQNIHTLWISKPFVNHSDAIKMENRYN